MSRTLEPFSWTMSKPWVLSRILVIFWIASLSWMILPPLEALSLVVASESAPFITDRIGRVASVTSRLFSSHCHFRACSPDEFQMQMFSGKSLQQSQNQQSGGRLLEPCREWTCACACLGLKVGKDEGLAISRLFNTPVNAVSKKGRRPISRGMCSVWGGEVLWELIPRRVLYLKLQVLLVLQGAPWRLPLEHLLLLTLCGQTTRRISEFMSLSVPLLRYHFDHWISLQYP